MDLSITIWEIIAIAIGFMLCSFIYFGVKGAYQKALAKSDLTKIQSLMSGLEFVNLQPAKDQPKPEEPKKAKK